MAMHVKLKLIFYKTIHQIFSIFISNQTVLDLQDINSLTKVSIKNSLIKMKNAQIAIHWGY